MRTMKAMKSTDELVGHMKDKGIKFDIVSEDEAKAFLENRNYYFKLSAYRTNYPKCGLDAGKGRAGQYQNLDFAYLQELSSIDKYLRYYVMEMCLDIEHAIKVRLVDSVTKDGEDGTEDGYRIVQEYLKNPDRFAKKKSSGGTSKDGLNILRNINYHKSGEYCRDLYNKYYPYFPVWVFVELISFGDLMRFVAFYDEYSKHQHRSGIDKAQGKVSKDDVIYGDVRKKDLHEDILIPGKFMNVIRDLRNAAAHSNCLINKATEKMSPKRQVDTRIIEFANSLSIAKPQSNSRHLRFNFTYNMMVLLYTYDHYVGEDAKMTRYKLLSKFLHERVGRHEEYFMSNSSLHEVYIYLRKVVDALAKNG